MIDRKEKLLQVRHLVNVEPHIVVDIGKCTDCETRNCIYICPAGCYSAKDDQVEFKYEGCLECGACRVMCPNAVVWDYPLGGYGVSFRLG